MASLPKGGMENVGAKHPGPGVKIESNEWKDVVMFAISMDDFA